jgi:hypothetical protein
VKAKGCTQRLRRQFDGSNDVSLCVQTIDGSLQSSGREYLVLADVAIDCSKSRSSSMSFVHCMRTLCRHRSHHDASGWRQNTGVILGPARVFVLFTAWLHRAQCRLAHSDNVTHDSANV